jgi:hypothetical protein
MPKIGESAVVYIDALGRFSGNVVRTHVDGFSMTIQASAKKREMLADKLTWFVNRIALNLDEQRRDERIKPFQKFVVMRLDDASEHIVKIRDLSATGVSLEAGNVPAIGVRVSIGRVYATVVRHFEGGFAAQFMVPFPSAEVDESLRL